MGAISPYDHLPQYYDEPEANDSGPLPGEPTRLGVVILHDPADKVACFARSTDTGIYAFGLCGHGEWARDVIELTSDLIAGDFAAGNVAPEDVLPECREHYRDYLIFDARCLLVGAVSAYVRLAQAQIDERL